VLDFCCFYIFFFFFVFSLEEETYFSSLQAPFTKRKFDSRPFFDWCLMWGQNTGIDEGAVAPLEAFLERRDVVYRPLDEFKLGIIVAEALGKFTGEGACQGADAILDISLGER
jgi:hypothetical protein